MCIKTSYLGSEEFHTAKGKFKVQTYTNPQKSLYAYIRQVTIPRIEKSAHSLLSKSINLEGTMFLSKTMPEKDRATNVLNLEKLDKTIDVTCNPFQNIAFPSCCHNILRNPTKHH